VNRASVHRLLAGLALGAAMLAAIVGEPVRSAPALGGGLSPEAVRDLAERIEREEDHVDALTLAAWIRARRPGLRLVDLRSPAEFGARHLPGSENLALSDLAVASFEKRETVVLISAEGGHALQGWVLLAARGVAGVRSLSGGYAAWESEVLAPELPRDADAAARAAFAPISDLSRYFGGRPRIVDVPAAKGALSAEAGREAALERTRRGGC
jgi:rhodanese-related sulfurtransferase